MKKFKHKLRLIRELIWNHTPYFLHLFDYKISEIFFKYNLYPPFLKNKGLRFFPKKVIFIRPNIIKFYDSERLFSSIYFIQDGDWDKKVNKIEEKHQYRVIDELLNKQINITELADFDFTVKKFMRVKNVKKDKAINLTKEKYNRILELIEIIKRDGYKTQKELGNTPYNRYNTWYDEIRVSINRNGEFILNGSGNHRLFIAQQLGIEKVPVVVIRKHYLFEHN